MGKKSKKGGAPAEAAPAGTAGDDELLELAAAANKAAAEAALAEAKRKELAEATGAGTEPRRPKLDELQDYLDKINFFDIRSVEHSDGREPVLSPSGEYIFYADMNDAAQALEERKLTHPGPMALGCTPLGRAFGLSEGKILGYQTNLKCPMRLQGSTHEISTIGLKDATRLCPPSLRKQLNPRTGPLPMFSLESLQEVGRQPFFFSQEDMTDYWCAKTGKSHQDLFEHGQAENIMITDLRVLIIRMLQVPSDWKTLQLVPNSKSVAWLQDKIDKQKAKHELARAAAEAAAADGPPPLQEDDEPPPLLGDEPPPLSEEEKAAKQKATGTMVDFLKAAKAAAALDQEGLVQQIREPSAPTKRPDSPEFLEGVAPEDH